MSKMLTTNQQSLKNLNNFYPNATKKQVNPMNLISLERRKSLDFFKNADFRLELTLELKSSGFSNYAPKIP